MIWVRTQVLVLFVHAEQNTGSENEDRIHKTLSPPVVEGVSSSEALYQEVMLKQFDHNLI